MNPVFLPWMAEIGVVTYRTLKGVSFSVTFTGGKPAVKQISGPKRLPLPSELLSTFVIFGAYAVVAEGQGERRTIGSLLAWGTVLATILMLAQHGTPAAPVSGTFPSTPTLSQRGQLTQPLPSGPNYPSAGGRAPANPSGWVS